MNVVPCPLCGYDAPDLPGGSCPHCALEPREPGLRGPRPRVLGGLRVGLAALPQGLLHIARHRGVKRWLLPPLILTMVSFGGLFWWLWTWVQSLIERVTPEGEVELPLDEGWLRTALEWVVRRGVILWFAEASGILVFLVVSGLAAMWAFSIVYEAISGPFLDEVHGKLEQHWFGVNPRDAITRPDELTARQCALWSSLASLPALVAIWGWWQLSGWPAWVVLLVGVPLPFGLLAWLHRPYGRWLGWIIRIEGGTVFISIKASVVAGLILVLFFPLKFVPFVGYLLFACVAGFTTAVSLLDIPFERRQWPLAARLSFLFHHSPAVIVFGIVSSLLFVVPFLGPALMVPAASVGGLWMLCRLDKDFLRPLGRRMADAPRLAEGQGPAVEPLLLPPAPPEEEEEEEASPEAQGFHARGARGARGAPGGMGGGAHAEGP